jgi:hypothetical protein
MERLPNGALVLKRRGNFVLCLRENSRTTPFVVWFVDEDGDTNWGQYFDDIDVAMSNLRIRSGEAGDSIIVKTKYTLTATTETPHRYYPDADAETIERMSRDAFENDPRMWLDLILESKDVNLDVKVEVIS